MYIAEPVVRAVTGIMLALTASMVVIRLVVLPAMLRRTPNANDFWLLIAFICYIGLWTMYTVLVPLLFSLAEISEGTRKIPDDYEAQILLMLRQVFPCSILLWCSLWSVKFSLLTFYKQLMSRLKTYLRLWWVVVVFCVLVRPKSLVVFLLLTDHPRPGYGVSCH